MSVCGHLGFYNTSSTRTHVRLQFATFAASGSSVAPNSAYEAADIRIYRAADGAAFSNTQRSSANGITMTSPFDSLVGFHDVDIDLTDNTDAGFYAAGYFYSVVLAADETIDSQTINGIVLCTFEIGVAPVNVTQFGGAAGTFSGGRPEVNTTHVAGTSQTAGDLAALINTVDDYIDTEVAAILAAVDTEVAAILAAVDTEVATIVTQTTAASIRSAVGLASANLDTQLTAIDDYIDSEISTIVSQTAASAIRSAVGLASANLDTQLSAIDDYVDTEVAAILAAVDTEISAIIGYVDDIGVAGAGLSAIPWNASWDAEVQSEVDDALKAALTEGYRSAGATGSVRDLLYELIAHMGESSIAGTTKTLKKLDGSTTAKTYTLDSATTPTSISETT